MLLVLTITTEHNININNNINIYTNSISNTITRIFEQHVPMLIVVIQIRFYILVLFCCYC